MRFLITLFLFYLALSGCSSPYVVRMEPDTEVSAHRYGVKLVVRSNEDAKVTVSFYDSSPKYVVFHLEVENTSSTAFDFDPASCLLAGDAGPVQQAIDPEVQLLSMDIKSVKSTRAAKGFAIAGVAASIAGAALAANTGAADSYLYSDLAINTTSDLSFVLRDEDNEDLVARGEVAPLDGEEPPPSNRYFWLDYAFRITTIDPGKTAFGKVAFPRNDEAEYFNFIVTVQDEEFSFPFNQKRFRP
ncbi:hypothetical protein FUA23_18125 [Neolewinella aurantiaca]|uniref:Uncharacterized protein n=1 Tax=Neolewinella aurantiaca TaxID=2602767 RepID=A0A5C7FDN7_9BACT|nr:hypothetical protein [Neolewinella aurantiaca]TXF87618.1 hypothetical protein FUA23_18125 [Neolewinella aurantiaca]